MYDLESTDQRSVGTLIKLIMDVRKITPDQLAKNLMVSRYYINDLLQGNINMTLELARNLSVILKMPIQSFLSKKR